jgi:DNA-binding CsgD family transcriptional regulator/tetratricopeptide (TPR) repeat protein
MAAGAAAEGAFAERAWTVVYRQLSQAPPEELTPADLDRLAVAAFLIGEDDAAVDAWKRAYERHADAGDPAESARCAFWAAFCLMMRGQMAHAGGWLSRAESALGPDLDCQAGGLAQLDQVMLAVSSGEVGPIVSGIVYCAVILECMQLFDLGRAAEWTAALDEWCHGQPDLVPYRGQCMVHQSQLRQASGDWPAAVATVVDAREHLSDPPHPALGLACYQEGELLRLRGEVDGATDAYRKASAEGYEPMPGLALLVLQRGDASSAAASIGRALRETSQPFRRPGLLAAAVEIRVAAGDAAAAAEAAAELVAIAELSSSPVLRAMADQGTGAALLASGDPTDAVVHLRAASATWQGLNMPYEVARVAVLVGHVCLASGDTTSAQLELETARATFESLGAVPDLRRVPEVSATVASSGSLSARELEVLRLVAAGQTSREIAASLTISQHTVRRHLENTFAKLGVSSRAAAVAHAYEHHLL